MTKKDQLVKMRDDVSLFGKVCIPNMFTLPSPQFHKELFELYSNPDNRKVSIKAPRGSAKSSIVGCLFPLHHLVFDIGKKFIVLSSKTQGHAVKLLTSIKDVLNYSEQFRYFFGYKGMNNAEKWTNDCIILKDGSMVLALGTGQQVVGLKHINQRPTLFVIDDPEDLNNTKTAEALSANQRWLFQSAMPAVDSIKGRTWVIGTPQHSNCIVETLPKMEGWATKSYKSIDGDLNDGEVLWEDMLSRKALIQEKDDLERIGKASIWYSERQCEIVGDSEQLFRPEFWENNIFDDYDIEIDESHNHQMKLIHDGKVTKQFPVTIFVGVDPASSTRQTADFSVSFPIAMDAERNRYTLRPFRKRATPMEHASSIMEMNRRLKPQRFAIETTGYQEMLRDYLREQEEYIPGLERKINPRGAKSARLESLVPIFVQEKVFILRELQWFIDEMLLYPRAKHEDGMDAFYYANKFAYPPDWSVSSSDTSSDAYRKTKEVDWMTL